MRRIVFFFVVVAFLLVGMVGLSRVGWGPMVITKEGEQKLILFLSRPFSTVTVPGVSWRPPIPVITKVLTFDARLLYLNAASSKIQTRDQERIVLDNYVIWRIADPLAYYKSFKGENGAAEARIADVVSADVREVVGKHTLAELLASDRLAIMKAITDQSAAALKERGIVIEDVRINRTELPEATIQNVYARMRTERERLARKYRAEGDEEGRRIRAEADRQAAVIVAEAQRDAELARGEGDAKAALIFAAAYGKAPRFYAFWRSLEAYRVSLAEGTTLVLSPGHGFFEFFGPGLVEAGMAGERETSSPGR